MKEIIIIIVVAAVVLSVILFWQKRKYEQEISKISQLLEDVINGREIADDRISEDTALSKITHQIRQFMYIRQGYEKRANEDRDEIRNMIGEIAHQLRTPLGNLETYLELLSGEGVLEEEQKEYVSALEKSEGKLKFLIESFIKMSRLEGNVIQIRKEDTDIQATVLGALFQVQGYAEDKNIEIHFACEEKLEMLHDKNWIGEAIYNLLDNSIKYSESDSNIEVSIEKNEMYARIKVRDYGSGIMKEDTVKIFRRFYRGKNVTNQEGYGIGLFVAREIAEKHQGFLKAEREYKGLTMSLYLPL